MQHIDSFLGLPELVDFGWVEACRKWSENVTDRSGFAWCLYVGIALWAMRFWETGHGKAVGCSAVLP